MLQDWTGRGWGCSSPSEPQCAVWGLSEGGCRDLDTDSALPLFSVATVKVFKKATVCCCRHGDNCDPSKPSSSLATTQPPITASGSQPLSQAFSICFLLLPFLV